MGDIRREPTTNCQVELDSHAEQCCVSDQCALIIHNHDRPVMAYGYDGGTGRSLDMVDAALFYQDPSMGDRWMLIINQALLVLGLRHPLLCTNQMRMNDLRVNDKPKHLVPNPTEYHHAIAVKTPDGNETTSELVIPLSMSGVFSYFEAKKPTISEWEAITEDWCIHLTYDSPEWEPTTLGMDKAEANMVGTDGTVVTHRDTGYWNQQRVSRMIASLSKDAQDEMLLDHPAEALTHA
jgi:hypothetical protein